MPGLRQAQIQRKTSETHIGLSLAIDGSGRVEAATGIGFFDHMLAAFGRHGLFDLTVDCRGDLEVDAHHTVEDVGICLGQALADALSDKTGVVRFGAAYVPMDEALARAVVDLSGRPFLSFQAAFAQEAIGTFPASLAVEFFRALADNARLTMHIDLLRGDNAHHSIEAIFKAAGRAIRQAAEIDPRVPGVPSTKGSL